jgi:Holliday junction DNA helicase RuvA
MPVGIGFSPVLPPPVEGVEADAMSALLHLGYRRPEVQAALGRVIERLGASAPLDGVIRESLKELAR